MVNTAKTLRPAYRQGYNPTMVSCTFCLLISSLFYFTTFSNVATAATYYLDAVNGNDNNPGTSQQPWKTLSRAYTWYSGEGNKVQEGDTVLFRDGSYGAFSENNTSHTGWITYKAAEGHRPEVSRISIQNYPGLQDGYLIFDGLTVRSDVNGPAVLTRYKKHIKFLNLEIIGNGYILSESINAEPGIYLWDGASDVVINNCTIHGYSSKLTPSKLNYLTGFTCGIYLDECNNVTVSNCDISQCFEGLYVDVGTDINIVHNEIHKLSSDGILFEGATNLTIGYNRFHDLYVYYATLTETLTDTVWSDDGTVMVNHNAKWNTPGETFVDNSMEIEVVSGTNCYIGDGEQTGDTHNFQISSVDSNGMKITLKRGIANGGTPQNVIYSIKSDAHTDFIQALAISENIEDYNVAIVGNQLYDMNGHSWGQLVHIDCQKTGQTKLIGGHNFLIENNLIWNTYTSGTDEYYGWVHLRRVDGLIFRNNTVIGHVQVANDTNATLENNIIGYIEILSNAGIIKSDYNIFNRGTIDPAYSEGPYSTFLYPGYSWDKWNDQTFTGIFINYANVDFRLKKSSVAIGVGNPSYAPTTDIRGYPRDAQPDAGCYEYANVAPVANNQTLITDENVPVNITLAAFDYDGDILTYIVTQPSNGTLSGTAPNLTYKPNPNYKGTDSFTFKVNDGSNNSNVATVTLIIRPGLVAPGPVVAWGQNDQNEYGQADPPDGNFVAIAAGEYHSLALKQDGSIAAWGQNNYGQADPCDGNDFAAIAAGGAHSLALKQDHSIVAWGLNDYGQADPCDGNDFVAIAAGGWHSLALKQNGSIVAWGRNDYGQADPCDGNDFVAIAAGGWHSLALKQDGSIVAWGLNDYGQADPCNGNNFIAIAAGEYHSLALKQDGTIVAWGWNEYGQASPPVGNSFVAIAAGEYHSLALKQDGVIVAWGQNDSGQADPCAGYNIVAISAGGYHGLAIMQLNDYHVSITKCTVTAGSKKGTDRIIVSGKMDATADEMSDVDANEIRITIDSADMVNPCLQVFSINSKTFKKGKYTYSGTDKNGVKKSFTYTLKTGKFTFSATKVALLGLGCPATLQIKIGDSISTAKMSEAIVNGPGTPIPIKLMMGVKDVLRVDKCTVKHGNDPNTDQLSVRGAFAVENPDVNMPNRVSEGLVITLDTQTFTIPANKLKAGKGIFSCSNAKITGGIAAANFNFNTCAFTLTIKNANIDDLTGDVNFGIAFAGYDEVVQVSFPIVI